MKKTIRIWLALLAALTGLMMLYVTASASPQNGWTTVKGKTYYYENGEKAKGFREIDGNRYYFNSKNGAMVRGGLKKFSSGYYLFAEDGVIQKGWQTVDGEKHYFDPASGKARSGITKIKGKLYYLDAAGTWLKLSGWQEIDGARYWFNTKTHCITTGLKKLGGYYYYFGSTGKMLTGWRTVDGAKYYFSKGAKTLGRALTGYRKIGSYHYFFDSRGVMKTGWKKVGDVKRYFRSGTGRMVEQLELVNDDVYRITLPTYNQGVYGYPLGCEGVSAYMALKGLGYMDGIGIHDFMDTQPTGKTPETGFMGDPRVGHYGVNEGKRTTIHPAPLAKWMNGYGKTRNISGSSVSELKAELRKGRAVIVYVTTAWRDPVWKDYPWGREIENNHALCVVGYRGDGDFLVNDCHDGREDGRTGEYWIDGDTFAYLYNQRHFAVAVSPKG